MTLPQALSIRASAIHCTKCGSFAWFEEIRYTRVLARAHLRPRSGVNSPRTQHAGDIANDLLIITAQPHDDGLRVYVYFTDEEMAGYLDNPDNGLHRLVGLRAGESCLVTSGFLKSREPTFLKRLKAPIADVHMTSELKKDHAGGHALRVWQVAPTAAWSSQALQTDEVLDRSRDENVTAPLDRPRPLVRDSVVLHRRQSTYPRIGTIS